ncbi:MAG: GNAT family N-acetyltransferase [Kordiimonadaceae bacterium]|jgi:GNAT superfamily N-acetyltransferase|nr:GNAT family N-acetyltransferase [Kordiimonadaceae bacterium]MBT6330173.1 GNAT family N-acetyltransferase [Kordiimonadaceae bacterium]MBT7582400.1 GNAT family N-acetyltransferase [Kordiimonadaceae bacterium]
MRDYNEIKIHEGSCDGLIDIISHLHGKIHGEIAGLGSNFEEMVKSGLEEFITRLAHGANNIWYCEQNNKIIASITIDGEALGNNIAHLRWFIVDNKGQSKGLGGRLMKKAMDFCDDQGFAEVHLWTYKGLDAAKSLYLRYGFKLAEEKLGSQYGKEVIEQKYIRLR